MKQRNNAIDILKGIGIILVLVAHSMGGFISQFSYTFHMPLFFIVTGLFISDVTRNNDSSFTSYFQNTVKKDFIRLINPALFTTIIIVLFSLLYYLYPNSYLKNPIDLIFTCSPTTPGDNIVMLGNLWFLFALFFGKMYFYLIRHCTHGSRNLLLLSFVIGGAAVLCGHYFTLPLCTLVGFSVLPYICIGYAIKCKGGVEVGIPNWAWIMVIIWCAYIFFGQLRVGGMEYSWGYVPDVMAACGGTFFFYEVSKIIDRKFKYLGKILAFLGTYSLILICAPTIETYCFPFQYIVPSIPFRMIIVLVCKVAWCALAVYACMKISFLRCVFGVK